MFNCFSIHIRYGLEKGIDVSLYATNEFDYLQMEQIRYGLLNGLEVSCYLNPNIDWEEMKRIRKTLENK